MRRQDKPGFKADPAVVESTDSLDRRGGSVAADPATTGAPDGNVPVPPVVKKTKKIEQPDAKPRYEIEPSRLRVAAVEFASVGEGFGYRRGPGGYVDLDEELAPGVKVADIMRPEWLRPQE